VLARIEAVLNFPDDDTGAGIDFSADDLAAARDRIESLLATADSGRILREGLKVVICGKPNVGKSSLLNALLREPRAIVTDVAGTTRDTLEESANIGGVPLKLVDTAGILAPRDKVEEEAVRRSRLMIESADIVLFVVDQSQAFDAADREVASAIENPHVILVLNKTDLPHALKIDDVRGCFKPAAEAAVSALTRAGLEELKEALVRVALNGKPLETSGALIGNLRHVEALRKAREALVRAVQSAGDLRPAEFVAEDTKIAVNALDAITGRNVDTDVVEEIFSKFCIGK